MLYFGPFDLSDLFMINRQAQPLLGDHTIRAGDVVVSPVIPFMVGFKLLFADRALVVPSFAGAPRPRLRLAPAAADEAALRPLPAARPLATPR